MTENTITNKVMKLNVVQTLTPEAFAEFGDVICPETAQKNISINYGNTQRYHDLANIDTRKNDGKTIVNIFRSSPLSLPIEIKLLERHPLSSQAFIPLGSEPYLVIVAPKGELREEDIKVFLASSGQGVNYHAGTWHHFSLALNTVSDFLVIDRGGEGKNCDEEYLNSPFSIHASDDGSYLIQE